jgi:hypothetical protein
LALILRFATALLLIGHGGYSFLTHTFDKQSIHWQWLGIHRLALGETPFNFLVFLAVIGVFEMVLGLGILLKPKPDALLFVMIWKLFTEFLFMAPGDSQYGILDIFEFIERWGSYFAPLALYFLIKGRDKFPD